MRDATHKVNVLRACASGGLKLTRVRVLPETLGKGQRAALRHFIESGEVEVVCIATDMGRRTLEQVKSLAKTTAPDRKPRPRIDISSLPDRLPGLPSPFELCAQSDASAIVAESAKAKAMHDDAMKGANG